ncbi:unnamed protein product [Haemonchus placei]|uniref:50S ribosomal protein L18 n=1 Tax=Haemonchus placei TaxID=6290 RepID=A0A0N4VZJ2_HAEPC|nr:unnamed protein product [Haemonchus placei]
MRNKHGHTCRRLRKRIAQKSLMLLASRRLIYGLTMPKQKLRVIA